MTNIAVEDIDVDEIWRSLGPWGKYQWKQLASYLFICVSWVIHQLTIVFIGYRPSFHCKPFPNDSHIINTTDIRIKYEECSRIVYENTTDGIQETKTMCENGWQYDGHKEQSFVTEWDFVCDNSELAELTQTFLIVGMMIGTFICPVLADKFGRKPVMVISHILMFGTVLATSFSGNYTVFVVLRILTGLVAQGALSGTTLSVETFPTEIRHVVEVMALFMWTTALCIMSPIAYALRNVSWRYLQITYSLLSVWSLFQWWMLDESLRWVIANGQIDKAREILKNACKWNRKNYTEILTKAGLAEVEQEFDSGSVTFEVIDTVDAVQENGIQETGEADELVENAGKKTDIADAPQYSLLDIVRHKNIFMVSLIVWYTWISDSLVYFGLYMITSDLYGDRYINFFLSAVVEYPVCIFEFYALTRIGRKWTSVIVHLVAAIALVVATILTYTADGRDTMLAAGTAFTLLGKMAITCALSLMYVVTPELYPTNMRNSGLGAACFMGNVGAMIAPFSRNVLYKINWLPACIYAVLSLVAVFLFAFVPETNGVELPQTIEELTEWYRVNKFELKVGKNRYVKKRPKNDPV